jgi:hypothetical protein
VERHPLHDVRIEVVVVRQGCAIQLAEYARLDLALEERRRRHHDVVARVAREQLRLDDLVRIEDVVVDLDAGPRLEVRDRVLGDVVGPVVYIENLLFLGESAASDQQGAEQADGCPGSIGRSHILFLLSCRNCEWDGPNVLSARV